MFLNVFASFTQMIIEVKMFGKKVSSRKGGGGGEEFYQLKEKDNEEEIILWLFNLNQLD